MVLKIECCEKFFPAQKKRFRNPHKSEPLNKIIPYPDLHSQAKTRDFLPIYSNIGLICRWHAQNPKGMLKNLLMDQKNADEPEAPKWVKFVLSRVRVRKCRKRRKA
jgi:hypothetical protein